MQNLHIIFFQFHIMTPDALICSCAGLWAVIRWARSWDQMLNLTADNSHRNHTVPPWKSRHTTGTHLLREHLIWRPGPAVAEVWYNIRLTLCTSLRACRIRAGRKSQGHASLGPDREIVLLVSLRLIFSSHYFIFFIFHYTVFFSPSSPSLSLALSFTHLAVPAEVNNHHSAVAPGHGNLMNSNVPNWWPPWHLERVCKTQVNFNIVIVM